LFLDEENQVSFQVKNFIFIFKREINNLLNLLLFFILPCSNIFIDNCWVFSSWSSPHFIFSPLSILFASQVLFQFYHLISHLISHLILIQCSWFIRAIPILIHLMKSPPTSPTSSSSSSSTISSSENEKLIEIFEKFFLFFSFHFYHERRRIVYVFGMKEERFTYFIN